MPYIVKTAAFSLSAILLFGLMALSVRGILDPQSAAESFGVPIDDPSAALYQGVYRSRNFMIALAGAVFLLAGMWRALAILTTAAILLPAYDIATLALANLPIAFVHPATLVALALVASLQWARVRVG
jgi:hypothetical protein